MVPHSARIIRWFRFILRAVNYLYQRMEKSSNTSGYDEKEAETLLKEWDEIETLWVENDKKREEVYKEALRSCDSRQWVKLIKTSYQRNQARLQKGKKATTSDERYLHMAEDNLFGELAIPFEMTKGEAEEYFVAQIRGE